MEDQNLALSVTEERQLNSIVEAEKKAEVMHRVQASFVIAKRFPRDESAAAIRIRNACKRKSLAEVAIYAFPRAGETITGPSIRLAEVLAQAYGNLDFGIRELEHQSGLDGRSVVEAYCSDLETNTHQRRVFTVEHKRMAKKAIKHLTDPRDVYEHVANYGARRMRACILSIIPKDVVEDALKVVRETLRSGGEPLVDRIKKMVVAFSDLGVSSELLEKRLGHAVDAINEEELDVLRGIYTSLKDGDTKRETWFDLGSESKGGRADELNDKVRQSHAGGSDDQTNERTKEQ